MSLFFFFNDTATTEIYTLSLHDALPISLAAAGAQLGLSGSTTIVGPGQLTNQGALELLSDTVAAVLVNEGLLLGRGGSAINGALTTTATSVIRVRGDGGVGGAALPRSDERRGGREGRSRRPPPP